MENASVQKKLVNIIKIIFEPLKTPQIRRMLVYSTLIIFSVETLVMILLEFILDIPEPIVWYVDGLVLVLLLFPLNFYFIIKPMLNEIDQHRQTNQELSKSNEILERFFDISEYMIAYFDSSFNFIRVNSAYAAADQHPPEYYVGKNHFELFPNEENQQIFEHVIKTGKVFRINEKTFEYPLNPERGTSYWDWSLMPVKNQDQQVIGLIMVLNDVTARKQAQLDLFESEQRFRAVFNQTFQLVGLLTPTGDVTLLNQTAIDFIGVDPLAISGKPLWEMPWWQKTDELKTTLQNAVLQASEGVTIRDVYPTLSHTGDVATMDITIKPLLDQGGKPILLIFEARDISARVLAEERLIKNEEEIQHLYQTEKQAHFLAETLRTSALDLSSSLISGNVYESLLNNIYKLVPFTSAHLGLLEDEDHLIARLARGEENWPEDKKFFGKRFDILQVSSFRALFSENKVVSIPDTRLTTTSIYFPGYEFVGSWIAIPLKASDQIIGLCLLEHVQPHFFTPDLIEWATAVASQAAIAIQNAWLFEQVRDGREQLQALSRQLVEVQESERQYIARELHDEAGQTLASLMVGLKVMESESADQQAVIARSRELKQIADSVLENLHRLSVSLRPAALDHLGLIATLKQHTEMISQQHNLPIQFEVVGKIDRLPSEVEIAIYRIVQEALTNIVRHASATRADVLLEQHGDSMVVIVEDNGVGFDAKNPVVNHLGLVGMQERATMLGGLITFESSTDHGSTIKLEVPWPFES
ncbi:MAG: PAS domain-containing protein [Anaerolineaceae bacterium]|nr:PAS domain-containing protein [Anaerolineaceae bacterium]